MSIIQRIKAAFKSVFPLRLNSTVTELEERLEAETFMAELLRTGFDTLREVNHEFLVENQRLEKALDDAHDEARHERMKAERLQRLYAQVLSRGEVFGRMPMQYSTRNAVDVSLAHDKFNGHIINVRLPELRLSQYLSDAVMRDAEGAYDLWAGYIANGLSKAAEREVFTAVLKSLNNTTNLLKG